MRGGSLEIVQKVFSARSPWDDEVIEDAVNVAASFGRVQIARYLLNCHMQSNDFVNKLKELALLTAIELQQKPIVELLLANFQMNPDTLCRLQGKNIYPIHCAARSWALEIVEFLLSSGAHINIQGGFYGSVLEAVVERRGDRVMLQLLLDRGADPNILGERFGSAFRLLSCFGQIMSMLFGC